MDDIAQEAKEIGFFYLPLTIDEFIERLGLGEVVYPAWKEHLRKVYPDPVHVNHNYILLTGAIGTGKSTFSKISALYTAHKLLCLKDLSKFSLFITKPIQFMFFHVKIEKAREEFIDYVSDMFEKHELFNELRNLRAQVGLKPLPITFKADGVKSNSSIGGDVIFYVFSEANFVNETVIRYKLDQAYNRFKSRFILAQQYLGNIIIDTSSTYEGGIIDHLGHRADDFYIVRMSQWQAKMHTGAFFKKGTLLVYTGGAAGEPKVLGDKDGLSEDELAKYEKESIIEVPKEYEKEFLGDVYEALISLAGVSVRPPDRLFNQEIVKKALSLPNPIGDMVSVLDLPEKIPIILPMLPDEKSIAIHIDTSIRGDNTGLALGYWFDESTIYVPVALAIHNYGDDIPMTAIEQFIVEIAKQKGIMIVTSDTYQSYKLLQDISIKARVPTKTLSTDQNSTIYFNLKKAIIDGTVQIAYNKILLNELTHLRYRVTGVNFKPKIDHPPNMSKDIADAVSSVHYTLREIASQNKTFVANILNDLEDYKKRLYNWRLRYIHK